MSLSAKCALPGVEEVVHSVDLLPEHRTPLNSDARMLAKKASRSIMALALPQFSTTYFVSSLPLVPLRAGDAEQGEDHPGVQNHHDQQQRARLQGADDFARR